MVGPRLATPLITSQTLLHTLATLAAQLLNRLVMRAIKTSASWTRRGPGCDTTRRDTTRHDTTRHDRTRELQTHRAARRSATRHVATPGAAAWSACAVPTR